MNVENPVENVENANQLNYHRKYAAKLKFSVCAKIFCRENPEIR